MHLTFLDAVGSKTGKLFPTGKAQDVIDGVPVTCIDMAMPMMVVEASQLGVSGSKPLLSWTPTARCSNAWKRCG
ncbi:hypothetical protein PshuTeo2_41020 [Pseudomonas hunanensis]|nr:hypothetical protein [Pseudomonas hunanensis]